MMHQNLMSNPMAHADGLCSINAVKMADCAPPTMHTHVVSESCAGYRFNVIAWMIDDQNIAFSDNQSKQNL